MSEEEKEAIKELEEEIHNPVEVPEDKFNTFILFNIKSAKTVVNYIDKLQKENDSLKEENSKLIFGKFREVANKNSYVSYRYISIDEIKEIIGYGKDEEVTKETIMSLLETMWEENNRLEDIEDRKVEVEYKNVFNKGVISVKDKIRNEIKELENILEKRKTIDIIEEINRLEELLGDD